MPDTTKRKLKHGVWPWMLGACILVAVVVPVAFPEVVRPLGIDPAVFEDIQWLIRGALGQKDTRPPL